MSTAKSKANCQLQIKLICVFVSFIIPVCGSVPFIASQVVAQSQTTAKTKGDEYLHKGLKYYQQSQFTLAIQSWQDALKFYRQSKNRQREGETLGNLGLAHREIGKYSKAIDYQQQALKIFQELNNRQAQGQLLGNLGNLYSVIGDYKKAEEYQQQSLTIAREIKDQVGEGFSLGALGMIYADKGNYSKAVELYLQSLAIAEETKDSQRKAGILHNLGSAYQSQGKDNQALEAFQKSLNLARELNDRNIEQKALNSLGLIYANFKDYNKAITSQQQSLKIAQEIGDRLSEALVLNNFGHTLFTSGKLVEAEKKLRLSVNILDSLRENLGDRNKVSIFDTQLNTYNLLQQILVAQNKPGAALEASELGRARVFAELMERNLKSKSNSNSKSKVIAPLTITQIKQIAKQQKATLVEYSIVPDDFLHQGKLKAPELELFIWVVKPTGEVILRRVNLKSLRQQNTSLTKIVTKTRNALDPAENSEFINKKVVSQGLKQLHELLIAPIAEDLPKDPEERVIFIPHETLFFVPFTALEDKNGKYLIEKHTIVSAPAIQILGLTHQQRKRSQGLAKDILVVGNPTMPTLKVGDPPYQLYQLDGTEIEAKEVANLLQTKAIIGKDATKLDIVKKMPKAKIIHIATHGLLDDIKQLGVPGAIALAPSGNDNGFLTSPEIIDLQLNAELVVLSACQTGRGDITGDGVIGLSRSLLTSGAASTIVSLWDAPDDTTKALMISFYKNLKADGDKARALRQAMLSNMKKPLNPTHWAAFTLMGESE
ncbi:CHAT domain-containing protein [Mastigocoleus testarum]|uniref:CHAT domain-containing protein n=1 Tax=Mastigocoleus testarum BC008 TaxID=371196 RepID=A0A0V8A0K5_9CYAN|nr:CHAT domain-containing tetratricopeptide repeat protein [Mastigocoleus testarum]KST70317.1 hypothetical protein BC008_44755 [Mastigocoleus testarum BC008]